MDGDAAFFETAMIAQRRQSLANDRIERGWQAGRRVISVELPWETDLPDWFRSEHREQRQKARLDRKHLERRSRRFLENYLSAGEALKAQYYRALNDASQRCRPKGLVRVSSESENLCIANATASAAARIVAALEEQIALEGYDKGVEFITDAYATVGIAYRRATGVYVRDKKMQELGTAAVHLLTMATSYNMAHPRDAGV